MKKVHRVRQFTQEASLKSCIDINAKPKKMNEKDWFWKRFFQADENSVSPKKTVVNVKNHSKACYNQSKKELFGIITWKKIFQ